MSTQNANAPAKSAALLTLDEWAVLLALAAALLIRLGVVHRIPW